MTPATQPAPRRERPILFSAPMPSGMPRKKLYAPPGLENSPEHLAARLVNSSTINVKTGCWEWLRTHNGIGYGTLTVNHRRTYAHRLAFALSRGEIPDGKMVLHRCDNPRCINPDHLELGDQSKNMRDCHVRGRSRIPKPSMKGETNGCAKLTAEQVRDIRAARAAGETQQAVAERFGISQSQVSHITRRKQWKHVA